MEVEGWDFDGEWSEVEGLRLGIAGSESEFQGSTRKFSGPHFQGQMLGSSAKVSGCTICLDVCDGKGNSHDMTSGFGTG